MQHEFEITKEVFKERSGFANDISLLILKLNEYDIEKSLEMAPKFYEHLEENVRNIYELYDSEIPFFSLYYLRLHGADNFGYTEEEYRAAEKNCLDAIKKIIEIDKV